MINTINTQFALQKMNRKIDEINKKLEYYINNYATDTDTDDEEGDEEGEKS